MMVSMKTDRVRKVQHGSSAKHEQLEKIKHIFYGLYQRKRLEEVMLIIETEHGVSAAKHDYKKKINQWGFGKSFTSQEKREWAAEARKLIAQGRPLPKTDRSGRRIPWDRIRRQEGKDAVPCARVHLEETASVGAESLVEEVRESIEPLDSIFAESDSTRSMLELTPTNTISTLSSVTSVVCANHCAIPIYVASPTDLHRVESMFSSLNNYYLWKTHTTDISVNKAIGTPLWDTYLDAFRKIKHARPTSKERILHRAAQVVDPFLRQNSTGLLTEFLAVLHEGILCLDWQEVIRFLSFVVKSCKAVSGPEHALTQLLSTLLRVARDATGHLNRAHGKVSDLSLVQLMRMAAGKLMDSPELHLSDSDAVYDAQEDIIAMLQEECEEDVYNPWQAEESCHDLVRWSSNVFGENDARVSRARGYLAWSYKLQGNEPLARDLLLTIWDDWKTDQLMMDDAGAVISGVDWCPAWKLARLCRDDADLHGFAFYSHHAFEWSLRKRGPTSGETLRMLEQHTNALDKLGHLDKIEMLKYAHPQSCSQLPRFQAVYKL